MSKKKRSVESLREIDLRLAGDAAGQAAIKPRIPREAEDFQQDNPCEGTYGGTAWIWTGGLGSGFRGSGFFGPGFMGSGMTGSGRIGSGSWRSGAFGFGSGRFDSGEYGLGGYGIWLI